MEFSKNQIRDQVFHITGIDAKGHFTSGFLIRCVCLGDSVQRRIDLCSEERRHQSHHPPLTRGSSSAQALAAKPRESPAGLAIGI